MKALDTNVLIRFLTRDDEEQAEAVYTIFKRAETGRKPLFVPLVVALEVVWVLESVYDVARKDVLASFESLLLMPILEFEDHAAIRRFIALGRESKIDLADLLIAAAAQSSGCKVILTFDKAAAKSNLFELIAP
ncbi:MAG: type II toxin-antitoxin system VapC family toxin [Desulfosudaceae bacterium]